MKKIITISVLATLLSLSVVIPVLAATGQATYCTIKADNLGRIRSALGDQGACSDVCYFADDGTNVANGTCAMCCLLNTVYTITDWIFFFLVAVAAIMVLVGGFNLLFAGGSPEKIDTGRKYIIFAAVGLLVGLLARAIPALVRTLGGLG
jgi:hypothetical protein